MTDVFPDSVKWYYYNSAGTAWVDVSAYVNHNTEYGFWGMNGNGYADRLADVGELRFTVRNCDMTGGTVGYFDPADANVLTGWAINTPVKMVVAYDGVDYVRFRGKVSDIQLSEDTYNEHLADVTVVDLMDAFYKFPMTEQSIETYKRGGEIAAEIVTATGVTPLATNYAEGDYEFPAAFDSVTTTTKAATELNKVALSENGYFYSRHDKVNGETLTFEAESTRNGLRTVSKLPKLKEDCGFVLKAGSATDHVLMAGTTDKVVMNEVQDAHINGTAQGYTRTHGDNILNHVTVTAYPKRIDTTEQTIYSLGTPLKLAPGETKTVNVKYQNATTKESCNAITEACSQPVATTDYLMNRNPKGTSTDVTSVLAVSVVYHTASADVTFTSTSAYTGYVTRLYLKGYGVYQDSPIKAEAEDSTSQTAYGERSLNIEQQYQRDAAMGDGLAAKIVALEKDPRTKLDKVTMIANTSSVHMLAFLAVDIGDMVKITESALNLADYYYVNGIEFSVAEGGVITFSWVLSENNIPTVANGGLTAVAVEVENLKSVSFPSIEYLESPDEFTIIFSVYLNTLPSTDSYKVIVSKFLNANPQYCGFYISINNSSDSYNVFAIMYDRNSGRNCFGNVSGSIVAESWLRIAYVYQGVNNPSKQFINGSDTTFSSTQLSGVSYIDAEGTPILLGGMYAPPIYQNSPDGIIKSVMIYNHALTDAEISSDNSSPGCITDGIIFDAPYVLTKDLSHYEDLEMTEADKVYDNVMFRQGTPKNSPICRLIP